MTALRSTLKPEQKKRRGSAGAHKHFTPERIKAIRNRLGLTQAEFGDRIGISQKTVSAWEIHGLPGRYAVVVKLLELERRSRRKNKQP